MSSTSETDEQETNLVFGENFVHSPLKKGQRDALFETGSYEIVINGMSKGLISAEKKERKAEIDGAGNRKQSHKRRSGEGDWHIWFNLKGEVRRRESASVERVNEK